jgi:hypothetical protein
MRKAFDFYDTPGTEAFDFYDTPGTEVGEIQTVEQEENNLSHKAVDTHASNGAIEIQTVAYRLYRNHH